MAVAPFPAIAATQQSLPTPVLKLMQRHKIPEKSLSLYVREVGNPELLLARHIDTPRNPASVMKVLTTLAGLELLGPNYTWSTKILLDGKLLGDTLHGNLIFRGSGDPFLTREMFWHAMASLRARGLRHIHGDLIIDNSLFEPTTGSPGDFDNRPFRAYNTLPSASLLNLHAHQFYLRPQGERVHIYADPPAELLQIKNRLRLVNGSCRGKNYSVRMGTQQQSKQTTVTFSGNYSARCGEKQFYRAVLPGKQYLSTVFRSVWKELGGTLTGQTVYTETQKKLPASAVFHTIPSKPLREIIIHINKNSNNVMARQLLLTIGSERLDAPGTTAKGAAAIQVWLRSLRVPTEDMVIDNGSGLSRTARISARAVGKLLEHAYADRHQPEFLTSLAVNGLDGTAKKRLHGDIPPGAVRMKTGALRDTRAMAGYIRTKYDRTFLFVALQNHSKIDHYLGTLIQDELLKWLYRQ